MGFVLCICRHCGFITYGERPEAESAMIRHLVRKHGVWYPTPGRFRPHYIVIHPPASWVPLIRSPSTRRTVLRALHGAYRPRGLRP